MSLPDSPSRPAMTSRDSYHHHHHHHQQASGSAMMHTTMQGPSQPPPLLHRGLQYGAQAQNPDISHHHGRRHHHHGHSHHHKASHLHAHGHHARSPAAHHHHHHHHHHHQQEQQPHTRPSGTVASAHPIYYIVPSPSVSASASGSDSGSGYTSSNCSSSSSNSAKSATPAGPRSYNGRLARHTPDPASAEGVVRLQSQRERSISLSSLGSGSDEDDDDDQDEDQSFDVATLGEDDDVGWQEEDRGRARGRDSISIAALAGPSVQRGLGQHLYHVADSSSTAGSSGVSTPRKKQRTLPQQELEPTRPRDRPPRIVDLFSDQAGGKKSASRATAASSSTASTSEKSFASLFWERQLWLMEHRGADGLSHCSDEEDEDDGYEKQEDEEGDEVEQDEDDATRLGKRGRGRSRSDVASGEGRSTSRNSDVLRTHGAGLPLARVKRVMKGSDDAIKMISHESPSLLSRLCTVFIAELTSRAARHAMLAQSGSTGGGEGSHGRRMTVMPEDLRAVTIGGEDGEGGSTEWEFLRDILES